MRIGDVELLVVSDGRFKLDGGVLFGVVPGTKLTERQAGNFALERETDLIANLGRLGVTPEDVDIVINTHLHSDHCGGNTRIVAGEPVPTFPRAEYLVQRAEWDDALAPNERTRATYFAENLAPLQERGLVRLLDGPAAVTAEVFCEPAPGHTRGHQAVWIRSRGKAAVCIGDMAQFRVQLERPVWTSAYDTAPLTSLETKKDLLRRAHDEGALVFFVHDDLVAAVERRGDEYRLTPAV
ncbi:MAG: MBL fold metallo-hydrolase [Chloroflexi bacterium]|nr:MBL fold metallo-hydrolase [Chloroflexota bacterium]